MTSNSVVVFPFEMSLSGKERGETAGHVFAGYLKKLHCIY